MNTLIASKTSPTQDISSTQEPVIRFESVAVLYRVPRERVSGIKEYAVRMLQRRMSYDEFWALQDISFKVGQGEVFGVIGRNGAGKSTMLKVMARVLHPTRGRVVMRGKVAPLLELGAGFHPELTGRENVYLNSALLGYTRKQVNEMFPAILDFAEIGDFINAPLRTYSTGMVARLGFSVATCVRPDILLVDEVLSVGDSRFQEKCLERINSFQALGTTTVIVSHSMQTIQNFCSRALWLDQGRAGAIGDVTEVIKSYTG
jgi:ABC-type polysaccharide/polyol phosphate transport system ATPase subunit